MPQVTDPVTGRDTPLSTDSAELRTWQSRQFFGARILALRAALSPQQAEKFNALSYARKTAVIGGMIERGHMI